MMNQEIRKDNHFVITSRKQDRCDHKLHYLHSEEP